MERKKPMNPGTSQLRQKKPMSRGTKGLARRKPLERGTSELARTPMWRNGAKFPTTTAKSKSLTVRPAPDMVADEVCPPEPKKRKTLRARPKYVPVAERRHMAAVAALGCVVCRNCGYGPSAAEVHHVRATAGGGQKASNYETIPLCPNHHRLGGWGIAFHAGPAEFERRYGAELGLLEQTQHDLAEAARRRVGHLPQTLTVPIPQTLTLKDEQMGHATEARQGGGAQDDRAVEMRLVGGAIMWRYWGDEHWQDSSTLAKRHELGRAA